MNQDIDSFGLDQIQTPQFPLIYPPSQEMSEEVFQAKGNLIKSIQTFLEKFNRIPFGEMPKILLQAWEIFFAIQHAQPEDTNELFQKLLEDLQIINKELAEYFNSPSWNHPTFFNDNEEHSEVKNIVEQPTKRGTRILESLQNVRVKKSSISLNNTSQISPVHAVTPVLPNEEPEYSLSMGYEHLSTIPETESDEVTNALMPTSIVDEERIRRDHEEYIILMEKLFSINLFPRPLENFHANTIVETLPTSTIPAED
nr:hypothetical protein [Tanacetum cinerariifolium]